MSRHQADDQQRFITSQVINLLRERRGVAHLVPSRSGKDISVREQPALEMLLGLPAGTLAAVRDWHGQFAGWTAERIAGALLGEMADPMLERNLPTTAREMVLAGLGYAGLTGGDALGFGGSGDVLRSLREIGLATVKLRPSADPRMASRFQVVLNCTGEAPHKRTNPWTERIDRLPLPNRPLLLTPKSSNVSGIAQYVWEARDQILRHVERRLAI